MTKIKVADYLVSQLAKLGIEEIFGLPGDYNFEIVEAIERSNKVNWIGSTNELNAGYAADGYARIKGYGAIVTTYGVGELSAMNAIAGCMAENVPVMKIVGVPRTKHIEQRTLLHHNLTSRDYYAFCRAYSNVVEASAYLDMDNAKSEIDRLINVMIKTKRPVYLAIPIDVTQSEIDDTNNIVEPHSNEQNLDIAVSEIIKTIEQSKNPVLIADILTYRFGAKTEVNTFLQKTKIPSCAFMRGMDIVKSKTKNYLGVYTGKTANKICYDYVNSSDCVILSGSVISDLNTMGFDFSFDIKDTINIQADYVEIKGKKYDDILIKDVFEKLNQKINYISDKNLDRTHKYEVPEIQKEQPLSVNYIYPRLQGFLKDNDIFVTEVGLPPIGACAIEFPQNINVQNQILWGSIGWATPCAEGCAMADKSRRVVLISGDGSHQLSAQEISTMMRNKLKPVIFIINNSGYTVERILCDNIHYEYNNIADWNYTKLPEAFKGECFVAKATTNKEFDEILAKVEIENKDKMCYIELVTDYMDIPTLAKAVAKHPEQLKE